MCTSAKDGGLRCASHTRPAYQAAVIGTPGWDDAAAEFAATPTGRTEIQARLAAATAAGNLDEEAACRTALDRGLRIREAAATTRHHVAATALPSTPLTTPQACLDLARAAHGTQMYADRPYVSAHVEPVGRLLAPYGPHAEMLGYLHDIVEDTPVTLADLRALHLDPEVITAVDGMTKRRSETKEQAALRSRDTSPLARLGKLADNTANRLGLETLQAIDPDKANRLRPKYSAIKALLLTDPDGTHNTDLARIAAAMEATWRGEPRDNH